MALIPSLPDAQVRLGEARRRYNREARMHIWLDVLTDIALGIFIGLFGLTVLSLVTSFSALHALYATAVAFLAYVMLNIVLILHRERVERLHFEMTEQMWLVNYLEQQGFKGEGL